MKSFLPAAFVAASALLIAPAGAHHGQEFFLLYDAQVQQPRHGIFQGNFSFIDEGTEDSIGLSPSLSLGILPRTAFNLRADFTDEAGDGWAYRSIEPGFQFDLTPPNLKLPLRIGLAVSYQFAEGSGGNGHPHATTDLSGGTVAHVHDDSPAGTLDADHTHNTAPTEPTHDHSTHDHGSPAVSQTAIDPGPDALTPEELAAMAAQNGTPPSASRPAPNPSAQVATPAKKNPKPATKPKPKVEDHDHANHDHAEEAGHSHSGGIHNHDDNLFSARIILEADLTPNTLLVGNLISVLPEGGSAAWGYALGLRHRFRPGLAIGVETLGDFDAKGHHEMLGAVFWEPMHHVLLKVGLGTGLTAVSPDTTLRAGILWMF